MSNFPLHGPAADADHAKNEIRSLVLAGSNAEGSGHR